MDSSYFQNGRSSDGDVTMQQRPSLKVLDGGAPSHPPYSLPALPQRSSPSSFPPPSPEPSRGQDTSLYRSQTPPLFAPQQQHQQQHQQQQYQQQHQQHQQQQQQHQIIIHQMEMNAQNAKNKRKQVKRACSNCRRAHAGCDELRPCSRCISKGQESSCEDWVPSPTSYTAPSPPSPKRQRLVSSVEADSSYGTVPSQHLSSYAGQGLPIRPYPYGATPQHEKNSVQRETNGTDHQQQQPQTPHHFTPFASTLAPSPFSSSSASQGHFDPSKKPLAARPPSPAPQHPHSSPSHFLPQQTNGSEERKYTLTLPVPPSFVSNASPNYSSVPTPVLSSPSPSYALESPSSSGDRGSRLLPSPLYFENQRDSFLSDGPSAPSFGSNNTSELIRAQQDLERLNSLLRNRNEEVFNLQQKNRELEERLKDIVGSCNPSECSRQLPTCHGYRERFFPPQHLWGSTPSLLFPQSSSTGTARKSRVLEGSIKADSPLSSLMEAASELQNGDPKATSSSENLPSCDSFDANWRFVAGSSSDGDNVNKWFSFQPSNLGRPSIAASCWEWIESGSPSEIKQRPIVLKNCNQKFVDTTGYPVSMLAEDFALFDIVPKRVQTSLRSVIDQMVVLNEDYAEVKFIVTSYTGRELCISASLHLSLNSSLLVAQRQSQPQLQLQPQSHPVSSVPSPHSPFAVSPSPQSPAMCCSSLTKSGSTCDSPCHTGEGSGHPPSPSVASPSLTGSSSGIRLPSLSQISKPDARPPPAPAPTPSLQTQIQEGCGPFKTNCSTTPSASTSHGTSKNNLPMITKVETSGITRSVPAPVPAFKVPSVPSPSPSSSSSSSLSLSSSGGPLPGAAMLGLLSPNVSKAPSADRFYQLWIQMIPIDHYDDHYRVGDRIHNRTYRASCEDFCNCSATSAPLRRKRN